VAFGRTDGREPRTYKFALGHALLEHGSSGRADVPLHELAVPYAMSLIKHLQCQSAVRFANEISSA
jgi:hypothetical protein